MKIAVVGLAQSTHDAAPLADPSWQCWGLAWDPAYFRFDRLFEMHDRSDLDARRKPEFWANIGEFDGPVYMQQAWTDIPNSTAYPLDTVSKDVFRGFPRGRWSGQADWYGSSIAYMLALAIHCAPDEIGIWGVDVNDDEYAYERHCLEYLIGLAVGRGVRVTIPEGPTALGKVEFPAALHGQYLHRYGYPA